MLPVRLARLRRMLPLAVCLGLAALPGSPARAAPKALTPEEQAKVDRAIDKGIEYLKNTQRKNGSWPDSDRRAAGGGAGTYLLGYTLLPALALLESGVPATDPCVQKAADLARKNAAKIKDTYDVSLAVLLLDRLGDPKDEELVRDLALRLVAFQSYSGGWGYSCPTLSKKNRDDLWRVLRDPPEEEKPRPGAGKAAPEVPPGLKRLAIFKPPSELLRPIEPLGKGTLLYVGTTDNSNTQFALLALWAARRHGVPVERTLRLAVQRFRLSQQRDGTWTYYYPTEIDRNWKSSRSMTTVGLLGLAIGHGLDAKDGAKPPPDRQILAGFAALSREIGAPTAQMDRRLPLPETYFLWSVERVAALYNLPEIGDRDWYRWGAEILVTNQAKQYGSWPLESAPSPAAAPLVNDTSPSYVRTSFALLFLKRSNLTRDLTAKLPFKADELNKGIIATRAGGGPTGIPSPGQSERKR
jgi:hypothetical protein